MPAEGPQKRASSDFPDPFGTVPRKLGNSQVSAGSSQRFAERCLPGGASAGAGRVGAGRVGGPGRQP